MTEWIVTHDGWLDDWCVVGRIVRCRDCVSAHVWDLSSIYGNHDHDVMFCLRFVDGMRMTVEPDGFCAWGVRKEVDE